MAPLQFSDAAPRMVIAPRADSILRLIEATRSGAIRSGSFAVASPKRFASLVRAYRSSELLDVALGRLPTNLTARDGMTGLQFAAVGVAAIFAVFLGVADFSALQAVSTAALWLIFSASVTLDRWSRWRAIPKFGLPTSAMTNFPIIRCGRALSRGAHR